MTIHKKTSNKSFFQESRLLKLKAPDRRDLLDLAEQTGGTMKNLNAEEQLKSETERMVSHIADLKAGFFESLRRFSSRDSLLDKKVQQEIALKAEVEIARQGNLCIGKINGIFRPTQRKLYLATKERIAQKIHADLVKHLEGKQQEHGNRFGRYSILVARMQNTVPPLRFESEKQKRKITSSLARLKETFEEGEKRHANGIVSVSNAPAEWKAARETEGVIKQQLLLFHVVDPEDIEHLLDQNARGKLSLEAIILSNVDLAAQRGMRKYLVQGLRTLRAGNNRHYRLLNTIESDPNIGSFKERLQRLASTSGMLGKRMKLSIAGSAPLDAHIVHQGEGYVLLKQQGFTDEYWVLDTATGEVTYRDAARNFHDDQLSEKTLSLAA